MRRQTALLTASAALLASAAFVQFQTRRAERAHHVRGAFIDVDGVRLHYREAGRFSSEAPALVMLHGLGSMIDDLVLSGLFHHAAEHYRVIAIDRPGYGHSSRPRDRLWTPAAQADLVHRALHELGVFRPILFGHSFGATVALSYAMRHPVERLILASGCYYPTWRLDAPLLVPTAIPVLGDALCYTLSPIVGRLLWPVALRLLFAPRPVPRRFRPFPTWMALRPSQLRALGEDAAFLLPAVREMRPSYHTLAMPTTIVCGRDDRYLSPRAHSMRLHAEMPGSELVVVPGAGHMVHHAAPDTVMQAILGSAAGLPSLEGASPS